MGQQSAQIVTVSHQHPCHSFVQAVAGSPRLITRPGEYEVSGVLIIGVATFHDREGGQSRGKNNVYLTEIDEVFVCHLGDLGHTLTASQLEEIGRVDVLLLPVGGVSTIDATLAAEVVRQLEPKIVIPMHYKTEALARDLESVDRFLQEMGTKESAPRPKLTVTKSNLPASTQIFLLSY